jgi:hypothetical protein
MVSFLKLWENMTQEDESMENTKAMKAIRIGLNIREDFWDDFIRLMNNPDAVAELLGIRPDQISSWGNAINHNLNKVEEADRLDNKEVKKHKVLHTGDL